jgi:hypothetical protein
MFTMAITVYAYINGLTYNGTLNGYVNNNVKGLTLTMTMVSAILAIPFLLFFIKKDINIDKNTGNYKRYNKISFTKYFWIIPFGGFNWFWANCFVSVLQIFMPKFMLDSYKSAETAIYGSYVAIQIIAGGVICPIVEELIFRGLIYKRMKSWCDIKLAAITSSLIFGAFHGNWVQAPYAIIIGLCAVYVYEKYKTVIAPCILHISANIMSILYALSISLISENATENASIQNLKIINGMIWLILIFGLLAFITGAIINFTVHKEEIKDENINSCNSML